LQLSFAQSQTVVSGKVVDESTGEPVPFANVYFYGSDRGTTTDFEGRYQLKTYELYDSLVVSYIGYFTKVIAINQDTTQELNVELKSETVSLDEVVIMSGENPAWAIIRNVVANKEQHDKRSLEAFEYDSYSKIELDINNITEEMKSSRLFRDIGKVMDSISVLKGDDGDPYIPIFFSEAISRYYVKNDPFARREEVKKTKISGIAIEDGTLTSQVIGAFYQEYNFYNNWLTILEKEFVSPIADGWKLYYDYDIMDTVEVEGRSCYQLRVIPNREEDLAFNGTIWISVDEFALKRVDLIIDDNTNLNFIEKIKIQQELTPTEAGPWLPQKTRVLMDVIQPRKDSPSFIAKFYNSIKNWKLNQEHPSKFYENRVVVEEDAYNYMDNDWEEIRHDKLEPEEIKVYEMIDTLKSIPVIKTYTTVFQTLSTGYLDIGKVDLGPYLYTYAYNEIEGHRLVLGMRTNAALSRKFYTKGYLAYGTKDETFKYSATVGTILSRKPWTELSFRSKMDYEQVGLNSEKLDDNFIFYASTKYGRQIEPYRHRQQEIRFQTDLVRGLTQHVKFKYDRFEPLYEFYYLRDPDNSESGIASNINTTSVVLGLHWGRDENFIQNDNERISLGLRRAPIIDVTYTHGLDGVFNSDFAFHRIDFQFQHKLRLGLIGTSNYTVNAGYIFDQLPYPLLENHVGNESLFYTSAAFNNMDFSEFVSDQFVSLRYYHGFQGLILNKIPLLRELKWRLLSTASVVYGGLRDENIQIIPETSPRGNNLRTFNSFGNKPYVEVGYGIENIFRFGRIDFIHRLTHLDRAGARPFSVKISFQFKL